MQLAFELVYTSVIAPASDVRSVADIVRKSRSNNRSSGLTGILVFDGQRFCQCLEGEHDAVLLLARRIATDPRHQRFNVLHDGFGGPLRRFGDWSMAYALDTTGTVIEALLETRGPMAPALLQQFLPELEIQPD